MRLADLIDKEAWYVKESPSDLGYQVIPGWMKLPDGLTLETVSGVAVDSKNQTYVFHRGGKITHSLLLVLDAEGNIIRRHDMPGIGRPHMVAVDLKDQVWIDEDGNHCFHKLDENGEILDTIGEYGVEGNDEKHFNRPTDIAFAPNGDVFISDGDGLGDNHRIVRWDKDKNFICAWGQHGDEPGNFEHPHAVTVDSKGTVFVSDRNNWRVQVFDADGNLEVVWSHLGRIYDLAEDENGDYFVVDGWVGRISKIDRQGKVLGFWGKEGKVNPGELTTGHAIAYCPDGDIVIGHLDGRVQRFAKRS